MESGPQKIEQQRIQDIAREYEARGYTVIVQPAREQLPDFLADYQIDLLAKGKDETVVVEVKSRASAMNSPYLRSLAEIIQQNPGWRFELILVNAREDGFEMDEAQSLDEASIVSNLTEARELLKLNHQDAALVIACSAAEATLRLLAEKESIHLKRFETLYLLKQLATYAVISRDEYDLLTQALKLRNALVHGFRPDDITSAAVEKTLETVSHLLESVRGVSLA